MPRYCSQIEISPMTKLSNLAQKHATIAIFSSPPHTLYPHRKTMSMARAMFKFSARLLRKIDWNTLASIMNFLWFDSDFFLPLLPLHIRHSEIDIVCTSDYVFHRAWLFVMNKIWIFLLHLKNLCSLALCRALLFFSFRHHAVKFFFWCGVSISQKKVNYGHTALTLHKFGCEIEKSKTRSATWNDENIFPIFDIKQKSYY